MADHEMTNTKPEQDAQGAHPNPEMSCEEMREGTKISIGGVGGQGHGRNRTYRGLENINPGGNQGEFMGHMSNIDPVLVTGSLDRMLEFIHINHSQLPFGWKAKLTFSPHVTRTEGEVPRTLVGGPGLKTPKPKGKGYKGKKPRGKSNNNNDNRNRRDDNRAADVNIVEAAHPSVLATTAVVAITTGAAPAAATTVANAVVRLVAATTAADAAPLRAREASPARW